MRSRRVMLRLAPYVATFGLLGATMAWQEVVVRSVSADVTATPRVQVDEYAVPTVRSDVPVEPAPESAPRSRSAFGQGGAEVDPDGSVAEPSAAAPVVIAELTPQERDPFSLVGVTWESGVPAAAEVTVRWRGRAGWSDWADLHQDVEPGEGGRPGTEPLWVGWADAVAVRVTSPQRAVPVDLSVSTVNPGESTGIAPAAVSQPRIIMRNQWGASKAGTCSKPVYGKATLGAVIHHTVGSNSYTAGESAKIVRGIQAYHMKSNKWCDIGYNFLVDRYGQIFEGRAGGITKPVRGAHAGVAAVNEETMGVSLMGTFTKVGPTAKMKAATAQLVAWRFSTAHLPAIGRYSLGGKTYNRINGHRDVISTECPGQYVYSWLGAKGGLRDQVAKILAAGGYSTVSITSFGAKALSSSSIRYAWNAVPGAAGYQLAVSSSPTFKYWTNLSVRKTGVTATGLRADTTYYAKVRALKPSGSALTAFSAVKARKTLAPGGNIVSGLALTSRSTSWLKYSWTPVSGAPAYEIRLSRYSSMANATSHRYTGHAGLFTGLSAGTVYYAQVRVIEKSGRALGQWSTRVANGTRSK